MARTISLARHLMLCKNMRAIFVFDPDNPPDREAFTWLAGQHQYQHIGVPASIYQASEIELSEFETFTKLPIPNDSLTELKTAGAGSHPEWVIESLISGSAYILPMILDRDVLGRFEQFCEWRAETVRPVPKDQIVRHVRIIGYGMQELFEESTEQALNALHRSDIHSEMVRRQSIAAADGTERFWRLLEIDESKNHWIGGYFDVLSALPTDVTTGLGGEAAIGLGLVGGVAIEPPYTEE